MEHSISKCPVCEAISWRLVFQEKIRDGLFGQYTTDDARIVECESCSLQKLDFFVLTPEKYESDEYRIKYNGTKEETDLLALHDAEQANRLAVIGTKSLRNSVIVDIGCGHGAFLDSVKGLASRTIGIEPFSDLHPSLVRRGHEVFSPLDEKIKTFRSSADLVTSFGVIEHLEDPFGHLELAWNLVKPGGRLILQTDNLNEILFTTAAKNFKRFFYRTAHNWYFSPETLKKLAMRANLEGIKVSTIQEYGFLNFIQWQKEGKPTGNSGGYFLGSDFEAIWRSSVERTEQGSLIMLMATKDEA